jgi:hypothetical protein
MAVVGADLPGLPAGDGDVATADLYENLLDMLFGIPLLLPLQAEHVHATSPILYPAPPGT